MKNSGFVLLLLSLTLWFCKKDTPSEQLKPTPYYVRLTDAPGDFTEVNVDIQGVEITGQGKSTVLNVTPGIYNLLDFTNGVDTLIATGSLTAEKVQQIRLILGQNNSVVVDSVTHPLTIPSGSESGLKVQVHQTLQAGVAYEVLLDFDANQSIVLTGNGTYHLKPVIRAIEKAISGSIAGKLSQPGVNAAITAGGTPGSYATAPDSNGNFIIQGVPAGTYTVTVVPAAPYSSVTIGNVQVTTGNTSTLGIISI